MPTIVSEIHIFPRQPFDLPDSYTGVCQHDEDRSLWFAAGGNDLLDLITGKARLRGRFGSLDFDAAQRIISDHLPANRKVDQRSQDRRFRVDGLRCAVSRHEFATISIKHCGIELIECQESVAFSEVVQLCKHGLILIDRSGLSLFCPQMVETGCCDVCDRDPNLLL